MGTHPERSAALMNGLIVLLLPLVLLAIGSFIFDGHSDTSVTVHADGAFMNSLVGLRATALVLLPFALLASWRTWAHAKRWLAGQGAGWGGVFEAAATACAVALIVLGPGIVNRPTEAPPYVIVYGGAALLLGLLVGVILRATAVLFLRLQRRELARD